MVYFLAVASKMGAEENPSDGAQHRSFKNQILGRWNLVLFLYILPIDTKEKREYNLGRPHAGAKILLYHAAAILSIVILHKRKKKFIPKFVILPLVIWGQIWYTIIVPREGARSRPPKKFLENRKNLLTKPQAYGIIKIQ